jgi:hypothetical protein
LDPRNMIITMHYFFKGEPWFQFANVNPSPWCPILKFWSNKVNGTPSNFYKNDYSHRELCSHENDYNHKNGIVVRHKLLHD